MIDEKITEAEIFEPDLTPPVFGIGILDELTGGKGEDDDGEAQ